MLAIFHNREKLRRTIGRHARVLMIAAFISSFASVASAQLTCYWELLDVGSVTTWGYTTNPDGTLNLVDMGTTYYYYWGFVCYDTTVVNPTTRSGAFSAFSAYRAASRVHRVRRYDEPIQPDR